MRSYLLDTSIGIAMEKEMIGEGQWFGVSLRDTNEGYTDSIGL